ncbi:MAG TPA: branched-chain amino acid ABC transporter permease [Candidatus Dormibacteraeota bacterium]
MRLALPSRERWEELRHNPNVIVFVVLALLALGIGPVVGLVSGPDQIGPYLYRAGTAGVFVLMAIGLNVVVGFAGLLDLGYAAFFAIGAYTYGLLASTELSTSPIHHPVHITFWAVIFIALAVAAASGAILGFPTLRLRGDYLAIVTLGFGEIVPRVFRNLSDWTGGVNGITNTDSPAVPLWIDTPFAGLNWQVHLDFKHPFLFGLDPVPFFIVILVLVLLSAIFASNIYNSRLGRAWMAIREDEVAAAAMGVNTRNTKLLAFGIGASFSGFAGAFYAAQVTLVSPDNFGFLISVTILVMVVLGGMGNVAGVMVGALIIFVVQQLVLPTWLPNGLTALADSFGLSSITASNPPNWPGLHDEIVRLNFFLFGMVLVLIMLLRPQGLIPSRLRAQELIGEGTTDEAVFDARTT